MTKQKIIKTVAQEYVDGVNSVKKKGEKDADIDTLFNFGSLGLLTPRHLVTAFYNSIMKAKRKK